MGKSFLTDEEVEREIAQLTASDEVKLARREQRLKYKRRQQLHTLRALQKRGRELLESGVTMENIDGLTEAAEAECTK